MFLLGRTPNTPISLGIAWVAGMSAACSTSSHQNGAWTDGSAIEPDGSGGSVPDAGDAGASPLPDSSNGGDSAPVCDSTDAGSGPGGGDVDAAIVSISLDGTKMGRTFDGVGAISGGGGNSRFLIDYPEPVRSSILDYLFKPGFGASLQILKVEIGGDGNSTSGAEPSHMHTSTDLKCDRGWEWWLMSEAKARNPGIKFYGLAWGAPGWVGGGNWWSQDAINYILSWLGCAQSNGLTVNYLGGRNENGYNKSWFENLHSNLQANGFAIELVASDDWCSPGANCSDVYSEAPADVEYMPWGVATDMLADPTFNAAIDIVGAHYPCSGGNGGSGPGDGTAYTCSTPADPISLGKPLWASENGSLDYNDGAPSVARGINIGYIDGELTSYINWPVIGAIAPNIPFPTTGLLRSFEPWSGAFSLGKQLWAIAHTTQFTQPGWIYVASADGYLGGDRVNGSYVTLVPPNGGDFSTIVETTRASGPQLAVFTLLGGLTAPCGVHVWATNLEHENSESFVHTADLTPAGGVFSVLLQPGFVYSLTTTTGQGSGTVTSPPSQQLALPYQDDFESYAVNHEARYMANQNGSFEVNPCTGRSGQCVRQMVPAAPLSWSNASPPYTLVGDSSWTDYGITVDAMLEAPGSVEVIARFGGYGAMGYLLSVTDAGSWSILKDRNTTLASGTIGSFGTLVWHTLGLTVEGSTITCSIDGTKVGSATDGDHMSGQPGLGVGLGSNTWLNAQFDNLAITGLPSYKLVNHATGWVIDISGASTSAGAQSATNPIPSQAR